MKRIQPFFPPIISTRRKLYLAIAAQMLLAAGAHAGPTDGVVIAGDGQIQQSGLDTTITQNSDRLAIDWASFNIQADERVQFIQPTESSVALNRILGNEASQIFGRLDANGHVILMNPNGVFFGENATVNVGGLVASGLAINPDDFMNGEFALHAVEGMNGAVINQGIINAATGGNIVLVGQKVENQGLISAKLGTVALAAGKEAVLTFDSQGLLGIRVSKEMLQNELGVDAAVNNSGEITAEGGRILLTGSVSQDIFSRAVNAQGFNAKTSVVMHNDGSFTLGGGADVVNTGTLNAGAVTGDAGQVVVLGENVEHSGAIHADSQGSAKSGDIELHAKNTALLLERGKLTATSTGGAGGSIKILGDRVGVLGESQIDASGTHDGGDIHIGGGFQGKNSNLRNASRAVVGADTVINANALQSGNGGDVVVWADQTTVFKGEINVRGGAAGGDGGFVEISGKEHLKFDGTVDRRAVNGKNGTLLLDPQNITIVGSVEEGPGAQDDDLIDQQILADVGIGQDFTISDAAISSALAFGDVTLQAHGWIWTSREASDLTGSHVSIGVDDSSSTSSLILEAVDWVRLLDAEFHLGAGNFIAIAGLKDLCIDCEPAAGQIYLRDVDMETTGDVFLLASSVASISNDVAGENLWQVHDLTISSKEETAISGKFNINGDLNVALTDGISTHALESVNLPSGGQYQIRETINSAANFGRIWGSGVINIQGDIRADNNRSNAVIETKIDMRGLSVNYVGNGNLDLLSNGEIYLPSVSATTVPVAVNVTVRGNADVILTEENIATGGGDLSIQGKSFIAGSGSIDMSPPEAAGTTRFPKLILDVSGDVKLDSTANKISAIEIRNAANVLLSNSGNLVLSNITGGGNFQFTSLGEGALISQEAGSKINLTPSGLLSISADNIHLGESNSSIIMDGGNLTLTAEHSLIFSGALSGTGATPSRLLANVTAATGAELKINPGATFSGFDADNSLIALSDGDDFVNIAADTPFYIETSAGDDTFNLLAEGLSILNLNGGEGSDTLVGADGDADWFIEALNEGQIFSADFVTGFLDMETLMGGAAQDSFVVSSDGFSGMSLDGGGGVNTLAVDTGQPLEWRLDGSAGQLSIVTPAPTTLSFANMQILDAGLSPSTFYIHSNINVTEFRGSGTAGHTFDFSNILGDFTLDMRQGFPFLLQGIEYFHVVGNGAGSRLLGSDQNSLWVLNDSGLSFWENANVESGARLEPAFATFQNFARLEGGVGANDFVVESETLQIALLGSDEDRLFGNNHNDAINNEWTINGLYGGLLNGNISFENICTLQGNGGNDTFTFIADGVTKTITAGAGNDTFILANNISAEILDGGDGQDTLNRDGLNSIYTYLNQLIGGDAIYTLANMEVETSVGGTSTVVGVDGYDAQWTINGDGSISVIATSTGGASVTNAFTSVTRVEGGSGTDEFILSGGTVAEGIFGGDGDSLRASDIDNIWIIATANGGWLETQEGEVIQNFDGIANLVGGAANDFFNIAVDGSITGSILGGDGADTLLISSGDVTNDWQLGAINSVGLVNQFSGIETLEGNVNNDVFTFLDETDVTRIEGGEGENTLDWRVEDIVINLCGCIESNDIAFSDINVFLTGANFNNTIIGLDEENTWTLTSLGSGTVNDIRFAGFLILQGGAAKDTLMGLDGDSTWQMGRQTSSLSTGDDIMGFTGMESLVGGAGQDAFHFDITDVHVTGSLDGGGGTNTLYASTDNLEDNNEWVVNGTYTGTLNEWMSFNNIQNLEGTDGVDTVTFAPQAEIGSINTQGGDDVVVLADAVTAGLLDGGTGNNVLRLFGLSTAVDILGRLIPGDDDYTAINFVVDNTDAGFVTLRGLADLDTEWRIDGDGTVTVIFDDEQGQEQSVSHTNIARLEGANGNNTFVLLGGGAISDMVVGNGSDTLRVESDQANSWVIQGEDAGSVTTAAGVNLLFGGIANLIGGSGSDLFQIATSGANSGSIDGGAGIDTLTAADQDNTWTLDGATGQLNTLSFANFETLLGGAQADIFTVTAGARLAEVRGGAGNDTFMIGRDVTADNFFGDGGDDSFDVDLGLTLSGALDGGTGNEVAGDYLNLNKYTALFPNDLEAVLGFAFRNFERIDQPNNQGIYSGGDATNFWYITGRNQGRLEIRDGENAGVYEFSDVHSLRGGSGEDVFIFTDDAAAVTTIIDGGAGAGVNTLDLSAQGLINQWLIDGANSGRLINDSNSAGNVFTNIAYLIGGSNRDTFDLQAGGALAGGLDGGAGDDQLTVAATSTWTLGGGTAGHSVTGIASFNNIENLVGSAGSDIFNLLSGNLDVVRVDGGAGDDVFDVALAGANPGTLIDGGQGLDSLTLTGGEAAGLMIYTAAANGGEFDYSLADTHFKLSHQAVENVRDNSRALSLEIFGSNQADIFRLGNGRFWLNGGGAIEYSNKASLAVRAGSNDTIEIAENLSLAESLTLANGTVTVSDPAGSSIIATHLILDATRDVGLASARLATNISQLTVRNSAGDIYLQEQDGLNLAEFSSNGVFDLRLDGNLTSSASLTAADRFRVDAGAGDITLRGANQLRDDVTLSGARVELHNAVTLTLVDVSATDLILRTQRGIEGDGPLVVSGLTEIDAQGDVRLDFSSNDFNRVRVTNVWNLTLVDQNTLDLLGVNASGTVTVRSTNNINLSESLAAGAGVDVASGSGSVNQNGSITTGNGSIAVSADNGQVNLGEDARILANGGSVNISAGSGNVNMGSDTRIAANGGNVNIDAAESVVVAEVVSSGNVAINAGSGNVTDGNGGATNVVAGELQSSANTGFGSGDALETQVGSIDIATNTGNVGVSNTGDISVNAIRTDGGNIAIANEGNVDLAAGSVAASNGEAAGDVSLDVSLGSVKQTGPDSVPAITGGIVLINAPEGAVGEGGLRVQADILQITALIKGGEIFVNPGADKIEYFSGSFKFEDQLLSVEPLDDINPAIFTNVRSYFYNDVSLRLPSDQRYDEEEEE